MLGKGTIYVGTISLGDKNRPKQDYTISIRGVRTGQIVDTCTEQVSNCRIKVSPKSWKFMAQSIAQGMISYSNSSNTWLDNPITG
jgi:hypothetical protein